MSSSTNPPALTGMNYRSVSATRDTSTFFKVLPSKKKGEGIPFGNHMYSYRYQGHRPWLGQLGKKQVRVESPQTENRSISWVSIPDPADLSMPAAETFIQKGQR